MLEEIWSAVSPQFTLLLIGIIGLLIYVARQKIKEFSRRIHHTLEETNQQAKNLYRICQECGYRIGAMRVYVTQYKNGDMYDAGNPMLRKWRVKEWVRDGTNHVEADYQGILASAMTEETDLVLMDGPSFTPVSGLPYCLFKSMCERDHVQASARCAVKVFRDGKWDIVAFLGADFDTIVPPDNIQEMVRFAGQVQIEFQGNTQP